jgi:hypothetical protein
VGVGCAARLETENLPKPVDETSSPLASASSIDLITASTAALASFFDKPLLSATRSMNVDFVMLPLAIRWVTVVRGDHLARLDLTNRPVTADRIRVTRLRLRATLRSSYTDTPACSIHGSSGPSGRPATSSDRKSVFAGCAPLSSRYTTWPSVATATCASSGSPYWSAGSGSTAGR